MAPCTDDHGLNQSDDGIRKRVSKRSRTPESYDSRRRRRRRSRAGLMWITMSMVPCTVFVLALLDVLLPIQMTPYSYSYAMKLTTASTGTQPLSTRKVTVSEGSLRSVQVAPTLAAKPGSEPGFFNPKRRVGRDFCVLSVAQWLARAAASPHKYAPSDDRPVRLLDAMCATGMQGLRVAVESPLLAKAVLNTQKGNTNNITTPDDITTPDEPPELQVVLNDIDQDAVDLATMNANTANIKDMTVTRRVAQALLHEESFEVCVLDPFGSPMPFLDAAVARAPHLGLLEICATDVGALYGSRPAVTRRHYHSRLSEPRPPCYRERGVRLLVAAVAQAAGRHDRGVVPIFGVSTEHFVLVSLQVVRGARGADTAAQQVQPVRICRTCGAAGIGESVPQCGCDPNDGAGTDAREEGPLWVGPIYDAGAVQEMANIASLEEADGLVSKETRTLLATIQEEALVNGMFYRRPGFAAEGKTPKLTKVMEELKRRGYAVSRTHFDSKALRSNAPVGEFDSAVKAVLALAPGDGDGADYRMLI